MMKSFVEELMERQARESDELEFKQYTFIDGEFNTVKEKSKNDLLKTICAFANSSGGRIVIGLADARDNQPTSLLDTNVSSLQMDEWELTLRNRVASTIVPRLYAYSVHHVNIDNHNIIVIDVKRSMLKPHAVQFGGHDEFYIRNGNQSIPMKYNDLRQGFRGLEYTSMRLREFRDERLAFLLSGDLDNAYSQDASLVIHVVPEWSFDESNYLDMRKFFYVDDFAGIAARTMGEMAYNSDGLIGIHRSSDLPVRSYVQIFLNGSIEAASIFVMNYSGDKRTLPLPNLEEAVMRSIYGYCSGLTKMGISSAYYVAITLLNTRGTRAILNSFRDESPPVVSNIVKTPFVRWLPETSFAEAMLPIATTLAHTFNMPNSSLYDENTLQNQMNTAL